MRLIRLGCGALLTLAVNAAAAAGTMTEVTFMDQEARGGGYVTRYLVTPQYLRMDYGQDGDDYVLYDRASMRVYNVTHQDRRVLVIDAGAVNYPKPKAWDVREAVTDLGSGRKRIEILVNGSICTRMVVTEKFLPDVGKAMGEMQLALAATQAATFQATPEELRDGCELARHVLETDLWFRHGFAIDLLHHTGISRRLLNSGEVPMRPRLFALPEGYARTTLTQMQGP